MASKKLPLVLAVAAPLEWKILCRGLGVSAALPEQGRAVFLKGVGRPCLGLLTGVGPVNAGLALGRTLGAHSVSGVVSLGIAGSFDTTVAPLCSTVMAEGEIWPEYGLRDGDYVDPEAIGLPLWRTPDGPVLDRIALRPQDAAEAMQLSLPLDAIQGVSLTVAGVTTTPERVESLRTRYTPLVENMEGFALALGCLQADVPFLEIRTVSNRVGARPPADWDRDGALGVLARVASVLM
jgi:futalosine hydrolase